VDVVGLAPDVQRWMAQWMKLQQWIFPQRFFRENLKLGEPRAAAPPAGMTACQFSRRKEITQRPYRMW
jgi:hypothetical protein